ncbi:YjgN family protein [Rahnella sp. PCH160]|uniref:YjgN family protein n=1 Tax=Rahnella sp. PCH160 TaxID=3447928 RepID=UPI0039FC3E7C
MSTNQKEMRKVYPFSFYGKSSEYFSIWIVNLFLNIITLGIYFPWSLVKEWRYFYENTELAGNRFELYAKPTEILNFILMVFGCVFLMMLPFVNIIVMFALFCTMPLIIIKIIGYICRSTGFRGTRFGYCCKPGEAYVSCLAWPFLTLIVVMVPMGAIITSILHHRDATALNFILLSVFFVPFFIVRWAIQNYLYMKMIINNLLIGRARFAGDFKKSAFIKYHFYAFILSIPFFLVAAKIMLTSAVEMESVVQAAKTGSSPLPFQFIFHVYGGLLVILLGNYICSLFLRVSLTNYVCRNAVLDGDIRITSTMSYSGYFKLALLNLVMVMCSFGLCIPHTQIRTAKYLAQCIAIEGDIDRIIPEPSEPVAGTTDDLRANISF